MDVAFDMAIEAENEGNLPIGAIIAMEGEIIARGMNSVMEPYFHPGQHAEMFALKELNALHLNQSKSLHLYTTLEPCLMCLGSIVLHHIGIVYFAAHDPDRGANYLLPAISDKYPKKNLPEMIGPTNPDRGNQFFEKARDLYRTKRPS